jgi:glycosyltransferase involved in cell wall biosynthesis
MAQIVMADNAIAFDGTTEGDIARDQAGLAFVALAEALAGRGHKVQAHTRNAQPFSLNGVEWAPLGALPNDAALFIANRSHKLLKRVRKARRAALWLEKSAIVKPWHWWRLSAYARRRPHMVFLGVYHAATYPGFAPGGARAIIPPATAPAFRTAAPAQRPPPPFAIYNASSARSLDWVLDLWAMQIRPAVPKAQLYVFVDDASPAAEKARALAEHGIVLRRPAGVDERVEELRQSRVFLYGGDKDDMFCMEAAEAQAMGVPAVVADVACMRERVVDRESGFVVPDRSAFVGAAIRVLTEDALWRNLSDGAVRYNRARGWDDVAADFEELRK